MKTRRIVNLSIFFVMIILLGFLFIQKTSAEQSGTSNKSGATSRLKTAYDWLATTKGAGYGDTGGDDWNTTTYAWGTMWNRIMKSAAWEPNGTLTADEVSPGKTFYAGSDNRTQKTGLGTMYANQALIVYDDYKSTSGTTGEYTAEEATWTEKSGNMDGDCMDANDVCQDTRTGLYWSDKYASTKQNHFTVADCDFYSLADPANYDGNDPDWNIENPYGGCGAVGNDATEEAINYCATLSLDSNNNGTSENDWYLPSQKELMQAYIDGSENNIVNTLPGAPSYYWSSTEVSDTSPNAWGVFLACGLTNSSPKTTDYWVRCVRRD